MRIYRVNLEHVEHGTNWSNDDVSAKDFDDAVKKATKHLRKGEKIESVHLIAESDY